MRSNRLFEIIYILLERTQVTARELAAHFEVSIRTIYRDVETLSGSGVPIYMCQGKNGGISLHANFVLNKTLLSSAEKRDILSALHSLNALDSASAADTLSKLALFLGEQSGGYFEIDYSDWDDTGKAPFETAKQAIIGGKCLQFDYLSARNQSTRRTVEPYKLWFKARTWYLKAFCLEKEAPRVFRFSRMRNVTITDMSFLPRIVDFSAPCSSPPPTEVVMRIEAALAHRVLDEFHAGAVVENPDGSYLVRLNLIEDEWLYGYILSFGAFATVIEPMHVRHIIKTRLQNALKRYQ